MDYRIDDTHLNYIKIEVRGPLEKQSILNAMKDLLTHPDYTIKHSFWDFTRAEQGDLNFFDMKEIVGYLRLYKPGEKTFANKSAMLVSTQFQLGFVNMYVSLSRVLPFKYRVFTKFEAARGYLVGNG